MVVGLDGLDLSEDLAHVAADIGHPVLAQTRKLAHPPAEEQDRCDDQGDREHDDAGQFGIGDEQQYHAAKQHQGVAQGNGYRRANDRLQHRGVGGQSRLDFQAAVGFIEARMQVDQVIEHLTADISHDALANPGHQIETCKGADGQRQNQDGKQGDRLVEQLWRTGGEALVYQQAQALAQGEGDPCGKGQGQHGAHHLPAVGRDEPGGQSECLAGRCIGRFHGRSGRARGLPMVPLPAFFS